MQTTTGPNKILTPGRIAAALTAFSASATLALLYGVTSFDQTPGKSAQAPAHWPSRSALVHHQDQATLLVFTHPLCSCTNATIAELARFEERLQPAERPAITFAVYRPLGSAGWEGKSLRSKIAVLPGAKIVEDNGGREAKRFGAATSGDVLLYSAGGNLLFHGAVTGSRGHEGDNDGLDGLLAAAKSLGASASSRTSPVFGCALGAQPGAWDAPIESDGNGHMRVAPARPGRVL